MLGWKRGARGQIALEFLVVYSFVLVIFILMFGIVASQRSATLSQQEYASLQLQTQNIANYIDQALDSGSGYSALIPLTGSTGNLAYNLSVSTTGVVIAKTKIGSQIISSYAFSNARNLIINGTLQQTSNSISLYLVPTYKGSLQLSNINGVIYVGQSPPTITSLARSMAVTQVANLKVPYFNGLTSYVVVPPIMSPASHTIEFWMRTFSTQTPQVAIGLWGSYNAHLGIYGSGSGISFARDGGGAVSSGVIPTPGQWYQVAVTLSSSKVASIYVNGVLKATGSAPSQTEVWSIEDIIGSDVGPPANPFYGQISNVQFYNAQLSSSQIAGLYANGLTNQPIVPANLIGWWPMNGNMNDYSGNGWNGVPNSINYTTVAQFNTHISAGTGNSLQSDAVGLVSSKGSLYVSGSYANYTNSNGNVTAYLSSIGQLGAQIGATNLTVTGFNGNTTLSGNIVGWWPLDEGYGNTIDDLSTHYHNGVFNVPVSWALATPNQTDFTTGRVPGTGNADQNPIQDGYISINASDSLANIARNDSFTAVGWINVNSINSVRCPGVIGDLSYYQSGPGFQLLINSRCGMLWINSTVIGFPSGKNNFPLHTWEMVAAEYNGSTGQEAVYLNGTVYQSGLINKGLDLQQKANYTIADDAFDTPVGTQGINGLNGTITNVQLYSRYLTPSQISSLYSAGITGPPIGDAGLVGWWPLNGNANDYSSNGNNGVKKYNVTFVNSQYTRNVTAGLYFANFTNSGGVWNYANVPFTSTLNPTTQMTMIAWVKTTMVNNAGWRYFIDSDGLANCDSGSYCLRWCCGDIYTHYFTTSGGSGIADFPQNDLNNGAWHMLASTYNGSKVTLYLDGIPENSVALSGTLKSIGAPITFGYGYNGLMADVQIYNISLTQYQVQQLYLQGLPLYKRLNVSLG